MINPEITDGQRLAIIKLFGKFADNRHCRLWMLEQILDKKVNTTAELSVQDWRKIRNAAYPNWGANDWEIGKEFTAKCTGLLEKYETEIIGQKRLF